MHCSKTAYSLFFSRNSERECCKLGFKTRDGEIVARQQRARKNRLRTLYAFFEDIRQPSNGEADWPMCAI